MFYRLIIKSFVCKFHVFAANEEMQLVYNYKQNNMMSIKIKQKKKYYGVVLSFCFVLFQQSWYFQRKVWD